MSVVAYALVDHTLYFFVRPIMLSGRMFVFSNHLRLRALSCAFTRLVNEEVISIRHGALKSCLYCAAVRDWYEWQRKGATYDGVVHRVCIVDGDRALQTSGSATCEDI